MDFIFSLPQTLVEAVTSTSSLLLTILDVNFVVLNTLVSGILYCVVALAGSVGLVCRGILLAAEEFKEFVSEICGGIVAVIAILHKTILGVAHLCSYVWNSSNGILDKIVFFVDSEAKKLVNDVTSIISGFKSFIVLVSNSILMILEFLPWSVSSTVTGIFEFSAFLLKSFVTSCNTTTASAIKIVKDIVQLVKENICDIPRDAYVGLLMIILTYLAHKYAKRRIIKLVRRSVNMMSLVIQRTILGYQHVYAFLLSCARKLNSVCLLLVQRLPRLNDIDASDETTEVVDQLSTSGESSDEEEASEGHSNNFSQLKKELETQKGAQRCIICLENPKNMIFLPCRHMCACQECCQTLVYRRAPCPLCRKFIRNTIRVYT